MWIISIDNKFQAYMTVPSIGLTDFLELSVTLANGMCREHIDGGMIENLDPAHIVIQKEKDAVNWGRGIKPLAAYQSPEQSGRLNHVPDLRSDLYVLGLILYKVFTGCMPYEPGEGEDWNTAHMYAQPQDLSSIRPEGAGILEAIIMKLLAKSPSDRYQSAAGLLDDLMYFQDMLQRNGELSSFEIGRLDKCRSLNISDLWVDRNSAMAQLENDLKLVGQGATAFRWVTGAKGVGKTSFIHKFQASVVQQGGWFVEGSCLGSESEQPYSPFLKAMRQWLDQLWCEETEFVIRLKSKLQKEFCHDVSTIVSIWPESKILLECEDASGDLHIEGTNKERRHFEELLPSLIRCLAEISPPLILFIDDLDQADTKTRALVHSLRREQALSGLLFIGACQSVEEWSADPEEQVSIALLTSKEVERYISGALHEESIRIHKLAQSIYGETGGNLGEIRYALEHWQKEKKLRFDEENNQWVWDSEIISYKVNAEEDILRAELSSAALTDTGRELLALAATIGSVFQLSLLTAISRLDTEEVMYWLQIAETEGLIYSGTNGTDRSLDMQETVYLFPMDAAHWIAYSFDSGRIPVRHKMIGIFLKENGLGSKRGSTVSAIDHLNLAIAALSEQEQMDLAEDNLQEGHKVLSEGNFSKGRQYAKQGLTLLEMQVESESIFQSESQFTSLVLSLRLLLAWTEYMDGQEERAREQLISLINNKDRLSRTERALVLTLLTRFHTIKDSNQAIQYGQEALVAFGWQLPKKGSLIAVVIEVVRTQLFTHWKQGKNLTIQETDEEHEVFCELLIHLMFPLLQHDPGKLLILYARAIRYGVRNGRHEQLVAVRSFYELILQRLFITNRHPSRNSASEVAQFADAVKSNKRYFSSLIDGALFQIEKPIVTSSIFFKSMREGMEAGDKDFAYSALVCYLVTYNGDLYGLMELNGYYKEHMKFNADSKIDELVEVAKSYVSALQEEASLETFIAVLRDPLEMVSSQHEEDNYSCGCRLEVAYLAGKYREALAWAKLAKANEFPFDWIRVRKQRLYEVLSLASLYNFSDRTEQKATRKVMKKLLRGMKRWHGFLGNQSSGHFLVRAEWERISGNYTDALRGYTAAIEQAKAEESALMEGIACERLAVCYDEKGMSRSGAAIAMMDACDAYTEWGAASVVARIRHQYADLLNPAVSRFGNPKVKAGIEDHSYDLSNIQPQAIERETDGAVNVPVNGDEYTSVQYIIEKFVKPNVTEWAESLLEASLRQAGANRGLLLRCYEENCLIEAGLDMTYVHMEAVSVLYAQSVVRWTRSTGKPLVLMDAVQGHWMKDSYVQEERPRSILCMPIAVPNRQESYILYLENRQMAGVFTDRDLKVLELLAVRMIYYKLLAEEAEAVTPGGESGPDTSTESSSYPIMGLTEREKEVLAAIAEGLSNREIAERFGVAETTIKTHASRVISKLGVKRRGQAVVRARELGMIEK